MDDFETLIDQIEAARNDADYYAGRGEDDKTSIALSREECTQLGILITRAFGAALMGKRDPELAEQLALLAGAFKGEHDEDEDEDEDEEA